VRRKNVAVYLKKVLRQIWGFTPEEHAALKEKNLKIPNSGKLSRKVLAKSSFSRLLLGRRKVEWRFW